MKHFTICARSLVTLSNKKKCKDLTRGEEMLCLHDGPAVNLGGKE